jgi:hypothetical protein
MSRIVRIVVLSVLALAPLAAGLRADELAIPSGSYKLEWRVPGPETSDHFQPSISLHKFGPKEKNPGIISAQAGWGRAETQGFTLVVDESKGTGKGLDTLYLIHGMQGPKIDLSHATRIPLKSWRYGFVPAELGEVTIDIPTGEPGHPSLQKVAVDVSIGQCHSYNTGTYRSYLWEADFGVRGGWYRKIPGERTFTLETIDGNGNGVYIDPPNQNGPVDRVRLTVRERDSNGSIRRIQESFLTPNQPNMFGSVTYDVKVSKYGDTVDIQPCENTGILRVEARDGFDRPPVAVNVTLSGPTGEYTTETPGDQFALYHSPPLPYRDIVLAPGKYKLTQAYITPKQSPRTEATFTGSVTHSPLAVRIEGGPSFEIRVGQTTSVTVGGKLKLDVRQSLPRELTDVVWTLGIPADFCLELHAGQDRTVDSDRFKASFLLLDLKGRQVNTKIQAVGWRSFGEGMRKNYEISTSKQWKPGTYTLVATCDLAPYGPKLKASRKLRLAR